MNFSADSIFVTWLKTNPFARIAPKSWSAKMSEFYSVCIAESTRIVGVTEKKPIGKETGIGFEKAVLEEHFALLFYFCHQLLSKNLEGDKLFRVLLCSKNEMCFTKFINGKSVLCCQKETCVDNVCIPHVIEACQRITEELGERQDSSWMMLVIQGFVLVFLHLLRRFCWKNFTQLHGE